jgi:hypothetical protein
MQLKTSWMTARKLAIGVISVTLLVGAGCKKSDNTAAQPGPRNDQQVANDIQAKINAETALNGQDIQVGVQNGVATLNGTVSDNASRALAANDSGTVAGVKTVINNLTVQSQTQAAATQPQAPVPPPIAPSKPPAPHRDRDSDPKGHRHHDPDANAGNGGNYPPPPDQGNDQVAQQQAPPPPQAAPEPVQTVAPPPPPPPRPVAKTVTIPAGTVVPIRITETLDSAHAQANDAFHGSLAGDLIVDGMIAVPQGSPIVGRVIDAKDAAHFKGSSLLSIELTQLNARGHEIPVVTDAYSKEGQGRGKNTAEKAGGGAALGAIIGALAGGGKGAAIGAAAGGGLGAGVNGVTRGQQVQIETESLVNFRLQSPVTVTTSQRLGGPRADETNNDAPQLERR